MRGYERVILESPFAGDIERNKRYLNQCMLDCLTNYDEAPFASHGLYTQCLNDDIEEEREIGMDAGMMWYSASSYIVVYTDFGISTGMKKGIEWGEGLGLSIEYRKLPKEMLALVNETG